VIFHEFREPKPVNLKGKPKGVRSTKLRGNALGFFDAIDQHLQWLVVMDDTGEVVVTPNPDLVFDENWTYGRRFSRR
jgi:hypothetical protein